MSDIEMGKAHPEAARVKKPNDLGGYGADDNMEFQWIKDAENQQKRVLYDSGVVLSAEADTPLSKWGKQKRCLEGGEGSSENSRKMPLDSRFTKGEILRENTKKTGLKSFKEDKRPKGKQLPVKAS